jgi:hypothetical protein
MGISDKIASRLVGVLREEAKPQRKVSPTVVDEKALGSIGPYRLQRVLGVGGMGTVYEAIDKISGSVVALKVPHQGDLPFSSRFERESGYAQSLGEVGDAPYLDHGISSTGTPFLAMPLLEGTTLGQYLFEHGALPLGDVLRLGERVAHVLGSLHRRRLIHRDVKPQNIVIDASRAIWLVDLGLAGTPNSIAAGGTASYTAPEEHAGQPTGAPADVYALGLVLLEALLGEPAHERRVPRNNMALAAKILRVGRDDVRNLILQMVQEDPAERIADGDQVARAITRLRTRGAAVETALRWRERGLLGEVPFVGRRQELDQLANTIQHTGEAHVAGAEGIGKSRLIVAWWRQQASDAAFAWPQPSLSQHSMRPFAYARRWLDCLAGLRGVEPPHIEEAARRELLKEVLPGRGLQPLMDDELFRMFDAMVEERPHVLICDHFRPPDDQSLALLAALRQRHGRRLIVIHEHNGEHPDALTIPKLSLAEMEGLAHGVPSSGHRQQALERANGNPFALQAFVIEPAADLAGALAQRIQRLDPYSRWLLRVASLAGLTFRAEDIQPIVGACDGPIVREGLRRLVAARLLIDLTSEDGAAAGTYCFSHAAIARAARAQWPPAHRALGARLFARAT